MHVGGGDAEHVGHERQDVRQPLLGARRIDRRRRRVLLHVRRGLVQVDGDGVLDEIGVVDAPAVHVLALRPLLAVLEVLAQAIGERLGAHRRARAQRRLRRGGGDRQLEQAALDRAVEEHVAARGAQPDALLQVGVRRQHERVPAGEAVAQDAADLLVERAERERVAEPLAVGRIHDDEAGLLRRRRRVAEARRHETSIASATPARLALSRATAAARPS